MAIESASIGGSAPDSQHADPEHIHTEEQDDDDGYVDEEDEDEDEEEGEEDGAGRSTRSAPKKKVKGKRGRKEQFTGEPLAFLRSILPDFRALRAKKGRGSRRRHTQFWETADAAFWAKFDWTTFKRGSDGPEDEAKVVKRVNKAIITWCRWRTRPDAIDGSNPWARVLRDLRRPRENAPRKAPAWQIWHREHVEDVKEAAGPGAKIWERNKLAAELFREESDEEKARLERIAEEEHQEALEKHNSAKTGLPSVDAEEQKKARRRLASVVKPLLELIGHYTGFTCVTLVGAAPRADDDGYDFCAVHHGETKETFPKNLGIWDPAGFKDWSQFFCNFVRAVKVSDLASVVNQSGNVTSVPGNSTSEPSLPMPPHNDELYTIPPSTPPPTPPVDAEAHPELEFTEHQAQSTFAQKKDKFSALREITRRLRGAEREAEIERLVGMDEVDLEDENWTAANDLLQEEQRREAAAEEASDLNARSRRKTGSPTSASTPTPIPTVAAAASSSSAPTKKPKPKRRVKAAAAPTDDLTTGSATPPIAPPPNAVAQSEPTVPITAPPVPTSAPQNTVPAPPPTITTPDATLQPPAVAPPPPIVTSQQSATSQPPQLTAPPSAPFPQASPAPAASVDTPGHETRTVDLSDAPDWLRVQYAKFVEVATPPEAEDSWRNVLGDWVALERALLFASPRFGLPKGSRPEEIGTWIQYARQDLVVVKDPAKFVDKWRAWWGEMNPTWCERQGGKLVPGGDGDWTCLLKCGPNGFLSVIATLAALQDALDCDQWTAEAADVAWVLGEVRRFAEQRDSGLSPSKRTADDAKPTQRKRVKRA